MRNRSLSERPKEERNVTPAACSTVGNPCPALLQHAGKPCKFVEIKDADHQLWRPAERALMLAEVEQFLKANLDGGATAQH